jgi:putative nucleotidyltransferase with HDIG domain
VYLSFFHRELFKSLQKMVLLVTILLVSLAFAKCVEYVSLYPNRILTEVARFPPLLPLASLLICVLIGSEIAIVSSFFLLVVMGATLAVDYIPFLLINFFAAMTAILFARKLHKRKEVFVVCAKVWLSILPMIFAFHLIDHRIFDASGIADLVSTFVILGMTAILAAGLLPILESVFQVMTDMTLMEYMDPDHELLRRLSLEAPGTYQHCLVVGNISEAAARAIGANGLFCRVSALYHDIGKLFNPHYFTENQLGGFNIHQLLTPAESTHVIIAHVPEGEILARKYHLPQSFIDVIREHHGTTMVYYFYCKQVELMGGDATKVNEKVFRYLGPKPRSKASAIIMIVDAVEAASRSMEEVTEESVAEMVDKLVAGKAEDGQFDECQLTFEELGKVKRAIVKALMVTRHLRIKYRS